MVPIIRVLQEISELEYWTLGPAPEGGDLSYPPRILFRYKSPSLGLAALLQEAVQSHRGQIRWDLVITERNWLLWPARIMEYARANHLLNGRDAMKTLHLVDPEFGKLANAELPLLAEHIAKAAAKLSAA